MALEIEKKFLVVSGQFKAESVSQTHIVQGYLSTVPERSVRIRIRGSKAFITIKGKGNDTGAARFEWEKEITVNEAESLLKLCEPGMIDKTRYEVSAGDYKFEVDEFHGENEGLVIAEIELHHEGDVFIKPAWLGAEVTGNNKYYNAGLAKQPFSKWPG